MKILGIVLAAGVLLTSTCLSEVDWKFHPSVHCDDGHTAPFVTTKIGAQEIKYVPPGKWALSGGRFIPPGKLEADAYIDALTIKAPTPWTPDRTKALHDAVLSQVVPHGATEVTVDSEGAMPVEIDGQTAYEICLSYHFYGQVYSDSVAFVEHGTLQLQFHFGSRKGDFADLHSAFLGSLVSIDGF